MIEMGGRYVENDSMLARSGRTRLRQSGEAAMRRKPGPLRKPLSKLSRSARHARLALRANTRCIVVGAGPGRVGSTALAARCQREGFAVSHEGGNTRSADHDKRYCIGDKFTTFSKSDEEKANLATKLIESWLDRSLGEAVVGDIGLANTQLMKAFLEADPRVLLIVQLREPTSFADNWVKVSKKPALWETHLMTSRGLTANRYPSRVECLRRYMRMIVDETRRLQKAHGSSRVHLVDVKDLSDVGPTILKQLGAKKCTWDRELGRNSQQGRLLKRIRCKQCVT